MRRNPWLLAAVLAAAAVAALSAASLASSAPAGKQTHHPVHLAPLVLAGAWSGSYGGAFSGTFKLHWTQTGSSLSGKITLSSPKKGTYTVTGSVSGSAISFGAVGAGATYTGSVSGNSMSGNYKSPLGGGTWTATKTA